MRLTFSRYPQLTDLKQIGDERRIVRGLEERINAHNPRYESSKPKNKLF